MDGAEAVNSLREPLRADAPGLDHAPVDPLPAVRVAGKILVRRSELDAWLAKHRVQPLETLDLDGIVREALQGVTHGRQSPKT